MGNDLNPTFSFVLDRYRENCRGRRLAPATVKMYDYFAEKFLKPKLGHHAVRDLRANDFTELFFEMDDQGFVPSTSQKCRVTASSALKFAQKQGWVDRNVVHLADGPKARYALPWVPSVEDVTKFLLVAAVRDPDLRDFARVLAATGVRPGEGCGLRPEDLDGVRLQVVRSIDCCEGRARVAQTKSDRARCITVGEPTAEVIRSRSAGRYVFAGAEPWRPDLVAKKFKRLCAVAGVKVTPISLRHFHATQLLGSGQLNVKQVAERLGHANPGETLRTYAHFIPSLDVVAAQVIEQVLEASYARDCNRPAP
jgi:integrase